MNTFKTTVLALIVTLGLASCGGDDPVCKTCTALQEIFVDGESFGSQTIAGVQYCDEALEQIENQGPITTEQNVGGITQTSTTTYTCE